jgi:hypothetical protein
MIEKVKETPSSARTGRFAPRPVRGAARGPPSPDYLVSIPGAMSTFSFWVALALP